MADSNITKSALASALKELMETTPFAKITVSDICAKCNMNRKSFYYHFKDKFDLVNWIYDVEYLSHVQIGENLIGWDSVLHLCDYFYENKDFYRKVMKVEDQNSFINHFRDIVSPLMEEDIREILGEKTDAEFLCEIFFCRCSNLCIWPMDLAERTAAAKRICEYDKILHQGCCNNAGKNGERIIKSSFTGFTRKCHGNLL